MLNKITKKIICSSENATFLSIIILVFIIGFNAWFLLVRGNSYIDSDMASNFLAAVVNNSESTLMSTNWYYSTSAELFSDTSIYQIILLLIKDNWNLARCVGIIAMQVILILLFLVFAKCIGLKKEFSILSAAFLISPLSYRLFLTIGFGAYYISNTMLALLALILILWFVKLDNINLISRTICVAMMVFVAIISGINGIKSVIFPYGAIALVMIYIVFDLIHNHPEKIKEYKCFEWKCVRAILISLISFCIGYAINVLFIAKRFQYESKEYISWASLDISNVFDALSDCLSLLGYQVDRRLNIVMDGRMSRTIFSLQGIANLFSISLIVYFMFSVIRLIKRFSKLTNNQRFVIVLFISEIIVGTIIFKFIDGYDAGSGYWVPVYPIMLAIMMIECESEDYNFIVSEKLIALAITVCVLVTSVSSIKLFQESPLHSNPQLVNVAKWLEDNGYEKGYGTFWNSNSVTFLTNGKIDMWSVYGFDNLALDKWLQKTSHNEKPEGDKIFALIGPKDELDRDVFLQYMNTEPGIPEIVYQDDEGYIVVEYK